MLSYSWGMTSNKRGCEAQTPSLVPPIEASPLLIYSHSGRPNGGVWRPSPNEEPTAGSGDPRRTRAERLGRETLAEPNKFATKAAGIRGRSRPTLQHVRPSLARRAQGPPDGRANGGRDRHGSKAGYNSGWLGSTPGGRRPQIRGLRAGGSLAIASSTPATQLLSPARVATLNHAVRGQVHVLEQIHPRWLRGQVVAIGIRGDAQLEMAGPGSTDGRNGPSGGLAGKCAQSGRRRRHSRFQDIAPGQWEHGASSPDSSPLKISGRLSSMVSQAGHALNHKCAAASRHDQRPAAISHQVPRAAH